MLYIEWLQSIFLFLLEIQNPKEHRFQHGLGGLDEADAYSANLVSDCFSGETVDSSILSGEAQRRIQVVAS